MHKDFKGNPISAGDIVGLPLPEGLQPVKVKSLIDDEELRIEVHPIGKPEAVYTIPSKNTFIMMSFDRETIDA